MFDKKINFKLLNIGILVAIISLLYLISGLWLGVLNTIINIIFPFFLAFAIAYAMYPFLKALIKNGIPKWLSVTIICVVLFGSVVAILILLVPMVYDQAILFLSNISVFVSDIANKYEINLGALQTSLSDISSDIIKSLGTYISDGAINILNSSIGILSSGIIIIFVAIYFLIDMDKFRTSVRKFFRRKNIKTFQYMKSLDNELTNYLGGLGKNMLIQFVEYTFAFLIIGHPNYLILGILAAVTTIIPYFGGLIINIIALIIASVISTKLLILTLIVCLICPNIDSYIISPRVYGKTNKLHPLVNIFAVFVGGSLLGFWGILLSLPVAIIIITTYKFYEKEIFGKIGEIKEGKKN